MAVATANSTALINPKPSSYSSFFRFKIPKLVAKNMQERSNGGYDNGDHAKDKKRKWFISKRVSLIFSSVFNCNKKTLPKSHSMEVPRNDGLSDHSSSAESQLLKKIESDEISGDKKSYSFKKLLEIENIEQKKANKAAGSSSLSRFFHKKSCSFNCMRVKINKIDISSSLSTSNSFNSTRTSFNSCNSTGRIAEIMIGRQGSKHSLHRVPSRILSTRQKVKMAHSLTKMGSRKKSSREDDGDECESLMSMESGRKSDGGVELCKKRILMGGKCRPLNHSGILEYDKDGVLLPDISP